jgi:DNA-directed RNA polymerase specialized sigma24 family protein
VFHSETTNWNELLARSRSGDPTARERLCHEIAVRLRLVLQCRLRGWARADLEDLLQNTLVVFIEKLAEIESNPQLFAYGILRNKIGDELRRRQRRMEIPGEAPPAEDARRAVDSMAEDRSASFAASLESKDLVQHISRTIRSMSLFCRTFFLGILEEKTVQELWGIFRVLEPNLQRGTFDKRVYDCRRKLRELLQSL